MERKRERERDKERESYSYLFYVCVYLCACASSRVFVYLNIALCAVCAHATRSALRSEEKTLEFVRKRKGRLCLDITLCLVKNRGKHEKKHVKKGKREKSLLFWSFFLLSFPLSRNLSLFAPKTTPR